MEAYQSLEAEIAAWAGYHHEQVVCCSSGTAALHLALEALRLPRASRVLVPDYTMIACARAVTLAGLTPVFVDCGPDLLLDPELVEKAVAVGEGQYNEVTTIMPVHVYGRRCNMEAIHELAGKYDLKVVEDLAEAHGIQPHPLTDAACWSFYRNKIIAGEEGGAVVFRNPAHAVYARLLRCLGMRDPNDYTHIPRGHNYRLSNCLAERIRESLRNVEVHRQTRRAISVWYDEACPAKWKQPARGATWVYDFRVRGLTALEQAAVVEELRREGIEARPGFQPCSSQEEYRGARRLGVAAYLAAREVVYLPVQPGVTTREDCIRAFRIARTVLGEANLAQPK